jgi:hypothetical protein
MRGAGQRISFGWQTSVGCIACLSRRRIARSDGDGRALARKKSVAPLTRSANGKKAKRCASTGLTKSFPVPGLRVHRLQALDTMKGVLGLMPVGLSPARRSKALDSQVESRQCSQAHCRRTAHRAVRIPTRVCLRVTTGTSEVDTVR